MQTSRWLWIAVAALGMITIAPGLRAQDHEERIKKLEDLVQKLTTENQSLKTTVDELQTKVAESGTDGLEAKIQEVLAEGDPKTYITRTNILNRSGGVFDHMLFGGEWRTRVDYRNNTADLLDSVDDNGVRLDYRFNLGVGFSFKDQTTESRHVPNVTTWFEVQAAGRGANNTAEDIPSGIATSVGEFSTRDNDLDLIRLYQAYVEFENMFNADGFNLKIGRQEIRLGSELLIGTNDFFTGTVHDSVRFDWQIESLTGKWTAFYAKEAAADGQFVNGLSTGGLLTSRFRSSGDEDELAGIYYAKNKWLDPVYFDLYYMYFNARSGDSTTRPVNVTSPNDPAVDAFGLNTLGGQIHSLGTWFRGQDLITDGLYLGLEFSYQLGHDEDHNGRDAMLIEFTSDYKLPVDDYNPHIFFSYYFAEGADSNDRLAQNGFKPLFISRHNNDPVFDHQYGPYSRFGNVDMIPSENVHVFQGGFKFDPFEYWTMGVTYLFAMANHSTNPFTLNPIGTVFLDDRGIGHEIDLWAKYSIGAYSDLFLNLSVFVPQSDFQILAIGENVATSYNFTKYETDVAVGLFAQIQVRF